MANNALVRRDALRNWKKTTVTTAIKRLLSDGIESGIERRIDGLALHAPSRCVIDRLDQIRLLLSGLAVVILDGLNERPFAICKNNCGHSLVTYHLLSRL